MFPHSDSIEIHRRASNYYTCLLHWLVVKSHKARDILQFILCTWPQRMCSFFQSTIRHNDTTSPPRLPVPSHPIWCSNDSTSTSKTNCREEILKNFSSLFYAIATPLYTFADNFLRFPASLVDADKLQQPLPPLARTGEEPSNWIKRPDIRHQTATAKVGEDSKTSIAWLLLLKNMKKSKAMNAL